MPTPHDKAAYTSPAAGASFKHHAVHLLQTTFFRAQSLTSLARERKVYTGITPFIVQHLVDV